MTGPDPTQVHPASPQARRSGPRSLGQACTCRATCRPHPGPPAPASRSPEQPSSFPASGALGKPKKRRNAKTEPRTLGQNIYVVQMHTFINSRSKCDSPGNHKVYWGKARSSRRRGRGDRDRDAIWRRRVVVSSSCLSPWPVAIGIQRRLPEGQCRGHTRGLEEFGALHACVHTYTTRTTLGGEAGGGPT